MKHATHLQSGSVIESNQVLAKAGSEMKRWNIALACLLLWTHAAWAGGLAIGDKSAHASGMGNAFTAVADDASAAWFNPAGAAFTTGMKIMLGNAAIIIPGTKYTPNSATVSLPGLPAQAATKSEGKTFFVPHLYYTYWDEKSMLGASISINAPFGLETDWPKNSSLASSATVSKLSLVNINPSVIFKFNHQLSVSTGFSYVYLKNIRLDNLFQRLEAKNKGGWGATASVMWRSQQFSLGLTYRSRVHINITDGVAIGGWALASENPALVGARATGNTSMTLPDNVNIGIAWHANDAWLFSAEADWTNWSTFKEVRINYAPSALAKSQLLTGGTGTHILTQNWKDTVTFRAGMEWRFAPHMRARMGYAFDPTPVNAADFAPSTPGNDSHIFSLGYSIAFNDAINLDLAYSHVYIRKRDQRASTGTDAVRNGRYSSSANVVATSLQYSF